MTTKTSLCLVLSEEGGGPGERGQEWKEGRDRTEDHLCPHSPCYKPPPLGPFRASGHLVHLHSQCPAAGLTPPPKAVIPLGRDVGQMLSLQETLLHPHLLDLRSWEQPGLDPSQGGSGIKHHLPTDDSEHGSPAPRSQLGEPGQVESPDGHVQGGLQA